MGNTVITCLLIYTFMFFTTRWYSCEGNSPHNSTFRCRPSERTALINFKHNLTYFDKDVSSSWEGEECCKWRRVGCDDTSGHINELDLNGNETYYLLRMENLEFLVYLLELKQLQRLDLSNNDFNYSSIPRFMGSMRQLRYLDLSSSSLSGLMPYELGDIIHLRVLHLSDNMLSSEIPASLGKLSNLKELDLSRNNLSIASSLRFPSNLESLDLSYNQLSGKIPTSIGLLSKLLSLDISLNSLKGTVLSETHFANLSSLKVLIIQNTFLTLNLSSDWVPPFQLESFYASTCKINGQFPPWLQTQYNLSRLGLSAANISGLMPRWFHAMQQLRIIFLSNNKLIGVPVFPVNFSMIILFNNSLSGEFMSNDNQTEAYRYADVINLSNNNIRGPLPKGLAHTIPNLGSLILTNNHITGPIPDSLCQVTSLSVLDIKNNRLSGVIPNCWANVSALSFVRLSYNNLRGHIPCFNNRFSNKSLLRNEFSLHLNDNMLSGEIPSCLSNLTNVIVVNIGENQLSGKMPRWFSAKKFRELQILRLKGNKFSGTIPRQICSLSHMQILDLGHNHFTGAIPPCLSNLSAMTSPNTSLITDIDDVSEVIQGIERTYTSTLPYLVDIDLSYNNLVGSIPDDITKISGLLSLNLSYNQLSGKIPENIGGLKKLISLDLSKNKLIGSIPTSLGEIYTLSYLDLSYNNLSGPIPIGNQLQTLSDHASIYAGNPYLCGDFLPRKCKSKNEQDKGSSNKGKGNNKAKLEKMGLGLVVMSGFATGFWGVVGCLVLNKRWRHAVFRRVEDGYYWLYDVVAWRVRVAKAKMNRR